MTVTHSTYKNRLDPLTYRWRGISVPSTFPPARRPIYIHPVAALTRKTEVDARPQIADALVKVITRHPNDRILIHTVSYSLNNYAQDYLLGRGIQRTITYHSASEKQRAIDRYLASSTAVLLAPSLDRGIDLPQDDCRVIVICKIPFPSLGDKQISARLHSHGGQQWYSVRTVRSLIQMTGRGMRSADDYCESYILDKTFLDFYRRNKHYFPTWWATALVWDHGVL